jgi:hypothetical protein
MGFLGEKRSVRRKTAVCLALSSSSNHSILAGGSTMKRKLLVLLIVVGFGFGGRAYAHHSFAATYVVDKEIKIEGKLVEFMYRNPHSFVKLEAQNDKGQVETWAVEWGGGAQLSRDGVSRDTLKPGDHVIVTGNPGRDSAEHRIRMHSITRPSDGWKWVGVIQ